jgi:hypothetical protein
MRIGCVVKHKRNCCVSEVHCTREESCAGADCYHQGISFFSKALWHEFAWHLPLAIVSVAVAMLALDLLFFVDQNKAILVAKSLFHSFHYLHLVFAATGTVVSSLRFRNSMLLSIVTGCLVPPIFCTLSDVILPFIGGNILGLTMKIHWCFWEHFLTVAPFIFVGIVNGLAVSRHHESGMAIYSIGFHTAHVFLSSMAAVLYLVSFGFKFCWQLYGIVFLFLILTVLVPCTLSDIIVPALFANTPKNPLDERMKKNEEN